MLPASEPSLADGRRRSAPGRSVCRALMLQTSAIGGADSVVARRTASERRHARVRPVWPHRSAPAAPSFRRTLPGCERRPQREQRRAPAARPRWCSRRRARARAPPPRPGSRSRPRDPRHSPVARYQSIVARSSARKLTAVAATAVRGSALGPTSATPLKTVWVAPESASSVARACASSAGLP